MSSRLRRALARVAASAGLTAGVVVAAPRDEPAWRVATPDRTVSVPADHVSHPDYKIEWWYYTGNLQTEEGRRFGYQLTFFRVGIDPRPANPSRWAVRDLHMAHFAIADIDGGRFHFFDRLQREGGGWAGAATDRLRVWNGRWSIEDQPNGSQRLRAAQDSVRVELTLGTTPAWRGATAGDRRWVTHGRDGYSQKGSDPGNASHYYSMTRLDTRGTVTVDGESRAVTGLSWMDHEFGTSMLEPAQAGWDWFALHLSDGRDLMLYQMRRTDGARDPHSSGTLVSPDGRVTRFSAGDYRLEPLAHWTSAATKARYPIRWRVSIPRERLDLEVAAVLPQQELHTPASTGVTYWEGAVEARGSAGTSPIGARGYMELTGYSGVPLSDSFR